MYAHHLERAFQPNNIASELDIEQNQLLIETREKIKYFTPIEIAKDIHTNINIKKAPGYRCISLALPPRNLETKLANLTINLAFFCAMFVLLCARL